MELQPIEERTGLKLTGENGRVRLAHEFFARENAERVVEIIRELSPVESFTTVPVASVIEVGEHKFRVSILPYKLNGLVSPEEYSEVSKQVAGDAQLRDDHQTLIENRVQLFKDGLSEREIAEDKLTETDTHLILELGGSDVSQNAAKNIQQEASMIASVSSNAANGNVQVLIEKSKLDSFIQPREVINNVLDAYRDALNGERLVTQTRDQKIDQLSKYLGLQFEHKVNNSGGYIQSKEAFNRQEFSAILSSLGYSQQQINDIKVSETDSNLKFNYKFFDNPRVEHFNYTEQQKSAAKNSVVEVFKERERIADIVSGNIEKLEKAIHGTIVPVGSATGQDVQSYQIQTPYSHFDNARAVATAINSEHPNMASVQEIGFGHSVVFKKSYLEQGLALSIPVLTKISNARKQDNDWIQQSVAETNRVGVALAMQRREQAAADKAAADKAAADKPATEKPATEKPATEKPAAEKPAAEKPAAAITLSPNGTYTGDLAINQTTVASLANLKQVTGNLTIEDGVTVTLNALTQVTGKVSVGEDGVLKAPGLANVGGDIALGDGAGLNAAALNALGGGIALAGGARMLAPALKEAGKDNNITLGAKAELVAQELENAEGKVEVGKEAVLRANKLVKKDIKNNGGIVEDAAWTKSTPDEATIPQKSGSYLVVGIATVVGLLAGGGSLVAGAGAGILALLFKDKIKDMLKGWGLDLTIPAPKPATSPVNADLTGRMTAVGRDAGQDTPIAALTSSPSLTEQPAENLFPARAEQVRQAFPEQAERTDQLLRNQQRISTDPLSTNVVVLRGQELVNQRLRVATEEFRTQRDRQSENPDVMDGGLPVAQQTPAGAMPTTPGGFLQT